MDCIKVTDVTLAPGSRIEVDDEGNLIIEGVDFDLQGKVLTEGVTR